MLVGVVAATVVAGSLLLVGRASVHAAERTRVNERGQLVVQTAAYASVTSDPGLTRISLAALPLSANAVADAALLRLANQSPQGDPIVLAQIRARSGRLIVSVPPTAPVPVADLGPAWAVGRAGGSALSPVFGWNGRARRAAVIALGPTGAPWGVAILLPADMIAQSFDENLGGLGASPGGLSDVDARGVAIVSWDPALRGHRLVDPARLAAVRPGTFTHWTNTSPRGQVITVATRQARTGYYTVFQQPTSALFADLWARQRLANLRLLAVLGVALGAVLLFGLRRMRTVAHARGRVDALLLYSRDLIVVVGADLTMTFVSSAVEKLLGYPPEAWRGERLSRFAEPTDAARIAALGSGAEPRVARDVRLRAADGTSRWFDLEASDLPDQSDINGVLVTCHEIGARKTLQDRLAYEASHDTLTGLANREVFAAQLEAALDQTNQPGGSGAPVSVLIVDLDRFKSINDSRGHHIGDRVLEVVATRLTATVRPGDLVARYGGDEFAVMLPATAEPRAHDVANRIRAAVGAPIGIHDLVLRVDASVGVAASTAEGTSPGGLVRAADQAMYRAKQGGRNRAESAVPAPTGVPPAASPKSASLLSRNGSANPISRDFTLVEPARTSDAALAARRRPAAVHPPAQPGGPGRWIPLVVAALVVVGVAIAGSQIVSAAQTSAEHQRLDERAAITSRVAANTVIAANQDLIPALNSVPWSLTDAAIDQRLMAILKANPAIGADTPIALARPDGAIVSQTPPGLRFPVGPGAPAWNSALAGGVGETNLVYSAGAWRLYLAVAIRGGRQPVAVVVLGINLKTSYAQEAFVAIGGVGATSGGFLELDATGRAGLAWDPALIGDPLIPPALLPAGPDVRRVYPPHTAGLVTLATRASGAGPPRYIVFQQPARELYRDIRVGWLSRDLGLFGIVALTVVALTVLDTRRERTARRAEERLTALLHSAHDIFVVIDADQHVTFVSSAVRGLLGHDPNTLIGSDITALVHPDDLERLLAFALTVRETGSDAVRDIRLRTIEGTHRWFDLDATDLTENPYIRGALATCHETSDRKHLSDELAYRAGHDPLTGLANRASFTRHLDAIAAAGDTGSGFAILFVDLDNFKPVNDTHGHTTGDDVLRILGGRLRGAGRPGDLVARLGGDEFALVLTGADDGTGRRVAARILAVIRQPIRTAGTTVHLDATIGVATTPSGTPHPETVVRDADQAMYQGKESGRGRYVSA